MSRTHRDTLLDPDVTETGVGVARNEKTGRYYAVQLFGRPKSQAIVLQIENRTGAPVVYEVGERKLIIQPQSTRTHWQCRSTNVKFWYPAAAADEEEPMKTEHISAGTRLVVTLSPAQELVITRQRILTGER